MIVELGAQLMLRSEVPKDSSQACMWLHALMFSEVSQFFVSQQAVGCSESSALLHDQAGLRSGFMVEHFL